MRKRIPGILLCVLVVAASCQSSTPSSTPPTSIEPSPAPATATSSNLAADQILRIALNDEPATLDPTRVEGSTPLAVIRALHRTLVAFDEHSRIVPDLADSWDVSADAKTLTFHLRDAKYSNGDPIVASDFVYSWRRLADPRTAAAYSYLMADIVGGPDLLAMAGADPAPSDADIDAALDRLGVEAPDPRTFVVHLNTPAAYFLSEVTLWVFVPLQEKWITSPDATEAAHYVSSGPFILDTWDHDSQIVLKPNPNWTGTKPTLTQIQMSILAEPAAAQAAYEAGEIDMVATPDQDVQRVKDDPTLAAQYREAVTTFAINYYAFNNFQDPKFSSFKTPGPTADKDFRIALTQSIDKQGLIDATYAGLGRVANSFVMPGIAGYQPDLDPYPFNLASAKDHMTTALAALGKTSAADLGKLKLGYPLGMGAEPGVAFLAEAWRQAFGLEVEQIPGEASVFLAKRLGGEYDISWDAWDADYPHANNQLSGLFTCGGGTNDSQYCNADFDALIKQAAAEPDQDKQVALYNQAQTILMNDAPILPIRFVVAPFEVKPYVSGLTLTPSDGQLPGDAHYETIQILRH